MTALAIGFPFTADRFGGSNVSSFVLARALAAAGHRIRVIAHGEGRVLDEAKNVGFEVERLPALSAVPGYERPDRFRIEQMLAFSACRDAIRRLRLDIVHTNDLGMLRTWAFPALSLGTALVAHWRSNYQQSWSVDAGLGIARAIIAISNYSAAALPHWARQKTTVEYNPLDLQYDAARRDGIRLRLRVDLGLPPDAAVIGIFGNHLVRKRTHVLADVLAAIPVTSDGRQVFGLACGARAEPYDYLLDKKVESFALAERLLRPGFVRPVEDWMGACDVVLAPAINEPLGRSVLEAQALGVPVVLSTDGGFRELVVDGQTGLICEPYDLNAWIVATRRLLDDRRLATALADAAGAVSSRLRPDAHARRVVAVYRSVLRQNDSEAA
ncbi:MAG TPA: glycosyltransferase family 4 protein [Rhizomicrobium sp.]|nr:glycosyltransferase family 4 protein [Rhizomicrobium sp.]